MKKKVELFVFLALILLINITIISAELTLEQEQEKVQLAYNCLNEKIETTDCSRMGAEQAIFSLLAVEKCEDKVWDESANQECWPKANCDLKLTSQAILALAQIEEDTLKAEKWLYNHNITPRDLDWYLEVDNVAPTSCTTTYENEHFNFNIGEDKKITQGDGDEIVCLSISPSGYWLKINSNCYDKTFETTCDENFITTLLFKKSNLSTIYVLKTTHSSSAGGTTIEKINSLCFSKSETTCNYEGSLWASLVLDSKGYDITAFMPYLIGESPEYPRYSPEAFLYYLTSETAYRTQIFENQISGKWWQNFLTNNKYYDTALELYPFQGEDGISEKTATKEWLLLEVQQSDGCWDNGNIVNNAFILHSLWPEPSGTSPGTNCSLAGYNCVNPGNCSVNNTLTQYNCDSGKVCCDDGFGGGNEEDCEENGFFCTSTINCEGDILYEYDCSGLYVCCDVESEEKTCAEWDGDICSSNEYCDGGETIYTSDLGYGEECCLEGICEEVENGSENNCEENAGTCESYECEKGYESTTRYSCELGETCCIRTSTPAPPSGESKNKLWIWLLLALIVLVVIGILLRDKIKMFLIKMRTKKGGGMNISRRPPGFPPGEIPIRRPIPPQRRIMPPQHRNPIQKAPREPREIDDVLKKLKDMSA